LERRGRREPRGADLSFARELAAADLAEDETGRRRERPADLGGHRRGHATARTFLVEVDDDRVARLAFLEDQPCERAARWPGAGLSAELEARLSLRDGAGGSPLDAIEHRRLQLASGFRLRGGDRAEKGRDLRERDGNVLLADRERLAPRRVVGCGVQRERV